MPFFEMEYVIFDRGNLVVSFDTVDEAQAALERLATADPEARDSLVLFAVDDQGKPVADCVPGQRLTVTA